jgi:FAD/FMN-containing dehydrogenase
LPKREWKNWMENQRCEAERVRPTNLEELKTAVREAAARGDRIRAAGGGYSWAPLVPTGGTVIDMRGLRKVHPIVANPESGPPRITVEAGATIEQLDSFVRDQEGGFTLKSPTMFPKPTIGGVVATGSHGVGSDAGNFSDHILEMMLVRADGSVRMLSRGDADFPAAQVALGSLGIVYSVTIELEPQFNLYVDQRTVPVGYVIDELDDLHCTCDYLEMLWFPGTDKMWLFMMSRTTSVKDQHWWITRFWRKVRLWFQQRGARALAWIAKHMPRLTPRMNKLASWLANQVAQSVQTASDAFHFIKIYPKNWDLSYAVPAEDADRAWQAVVDLVEEYDRAERYPINLAAHCRFVGPSEAWLAPNYGRKTCYIEVTTIDGTPAWEGFFDEIEQRWSAIDGARPHWGKLYGGGPVFDGEPRFGKWRDVKSLYPRMGEFLAVREEWDPGRVFLNEYLEELVFALDPLDASGPQDPTGVELRAGDDPAVTVPPR